MRERRTHHEKRHKKIVATKLMTATEKVAEHYANVVCPIITYQPKMSDEVKKLRNF